MFYMYLGNVKLMKSGSKKRVAGNREAGRARKQCSAQCC